MSRVKGIISPIRPDLALERIFAFLGVLCMRCGGEVGCGAFMWVSFCL